MAKKAMLVQTTFLSRVIVEVNEEGDILDWDNLLEQVKSSLRTKMSNDEVEENIETFFPDDEVPYNPNYDKEC